MRVGITGGIGSGKSTVCRLFGVLGVPVYDSDSRAKVIMNENRLLIQRVISLLGSQAYVGGELNRAYVGSRIFSDPGLLAQLNALVHPVVGEDFICWSEQQTAAKYVILESAILFESGFNRYADYVVTVSAPQSERIGRSVARDGVTLESIKARIANQMTDSQREELSDYVIYNDEQRMITDQVLRLHEIFSGEKI